MEFMQNPDAVRVHLETLDRSPRYFFDTQFFSPEFDKTRQQILTRLWGVLSNSVLERMLNNDKNKVDLFDAMNKGSLILINTAKDLLKQEGCEILGRFFIALIYQAVQERAAIPEDRRLTTFVYIAAFAKEMCCDEAFLQERRKHQKHTEFACFIRNHMAHPTVLDVPFGLMEGQPTLSEKEREGLLATNRVRFCETGKISLPGGERKREAGRGEISQQEML